MTGARTAETQKTARASGAARSATRKAGNAWTATVEGLSAPATSTGNNPDPPAGLQEGFSSDCNRFHFSNGSLRCSPGRTMKNTLLMQGVFLRVKRNWNWYNQLMKESLSYLEISKENLLHNISMFKDLVGDKKLVAVVKANAYGHGMKEVVGILDNHVDYFQVDDIEELRELRTITNMPTLVLGYIQKNDLEELVKLNGIATIFDIDRLETLNEIGKNYNQKVIVHVEVDALLGRLGLLDNELEEFLSKAKQFEHIAIEALYGHFSDIEDSENLVQAHKQYEIIKGLSEKCNLPFHLAATSGVLSQPKDNWGAYLLRLGIGMYGLWPSERLQEEWQDKIKLLPVLQWKTKIAQIKTLPAGYPIGYGCSYVTTKQTIVAIIPQGYSDGYDRKLSNNSFVLIGGKRCAVLGRIAMNMFAVDVSDVLEVSFEQEAVLLGKQGIEEITAEELAERIGTINYEVVARISPLLKRFIV